MDILSLNAVSEKINERLQDEEQYFNDQYNFFSKIITKIIQIVKSNASKELFATIEDITFALNNGIISKTKNSKEKQDYVKALNKNIDDLNEQFKQVQEIIDSADNTFNGDFLTELHNLLTDVNIMLVVQPAKNVNKLLY